MWFFSNFFLDCLHSDCLKVEVRWWCLRSGQACLLPWTRYRRAAICPCHNSPILFLTCFQFFPPVLLEDVDLVISGQFCCEGRTSMRAAWGRATTSKHCPVVRFSQTSSISLQYAAYAGILGPFVCSSTDLELSIYPRLTVNSWPSYFCFPRAGIIGIYPSPPRARLQWIVISHFRVVQ